MEIDPAVIGVCLYNGMCVCTIWGPKWLLGHPQRMRIQRRRLFSYIHDSLHDCKLVSFYFSSNIGIDYWQVKPLWRHFYKFKIEPSHWSEISPNLPIGPRGHVTMTSKGFNNLSKIYPNITTEIERNKFTVAGNHE